MALFAAFSQLQEKEDSLLNARSELAAFELELQVSLTLFAFPQGLSLS